MRATPFVFLLVFLLFGCQSVYQVQVDKNLEAAFRRSVQDASKPEPQEVSSALLRLTPDNGILKRDQEGRILMLTWTNWDGYEKELGNTMELTREIWVTAHPEVQRFCQQVKPADKLTLRLEQLLGLPPDNGKTHFVELWVKPEDIFRPCPDPEITDQVCELDFPNSDFLSVAEAHMKWINSLRENSYGDKGYPWTQLGYTYDWGNPDSEVGVSEFVVRAGAKVGVHAVKLTADYCARD